MTHKVYKGASAQPGDAHAGPEEAESPCRAWAPRLAFRARWVWTLSAAVLGGSLHPRDWSRYLPPVLANRFVLSLMGQRLLLRPKPSITESAHSVPGTRLKVRILGPIKCSHNNKGEVYFFFSVLKRDLKI